MSGLQIQRYNYRRSVGCSRAGIGCGCAFLAVIGGVIACVGLYAGGVLTPIVFQALGAERIGDTESLFVAGTAAPDPVIEQANQPEIAVIDLGEYGRHTVDTDAENYQVVVGVGDTGLPVAQVTITESGLLALCRQQSDLCASGANSRYRNIRFDLKSGGMVVYVDLRAGPVWQRVGLVMRIDATGVMNVIGVDVAGTTYNPQVLPSILPGDLRMAIAEGVEDIEQLGRDLLVQAALDMGERRYRIRSVSVTEQSLMLLLQ